MTNVEGSRNDDCRGDFTRGANGHWEVDRLDQAEAVVKIAGTPVVLALSDIYDGIPLPTPDAASSQPI